jgi:hypothetical protein
VEVPGQLIKLGSVVRLAEKNTVMITMACRPIRKLLSFSGAKEVYYYHSKRIENF